MAQLLSVPATLLEELAGSCAAPGAHTVPLLEAFTATPLIALPQTDPEALDGLFLRGRTAEKIWKSVELPARRQLFLRAHDLLLEQKDVLLDLLQAETGKSRGQAFEELFSAAATIRFLALKGPKILRDKRRLSGIPVLLSTRVNHQPKGVVGVITPWNYPLSLAAFDVLPAIFAGNTVIQKVDNQAPLAVLKMRQIFLEAGLPESCWQAALGTGADIGQGIVDRCDYLAFTGSTATGKKLYQDTAARFIDASMELGGKNALVVLPDADPVRAAKIAAYAAFSSMGQLCVSMERIYLVGTIAHDFEQAFVNELRALKIGAGYDYSHDYGSLISATQLENLTETIEDAVSQGATIISGGNPLPEYGPYFHEPTVLKGVTASMRCYRQETFGPLVSLYPVPSFGHAIAEINDSEMGLNASVVTGNPRSVKKFAPRIQTGSVNINEGYRATFSATAAPMGGMKESGIGRRNGAEGLLRFTNSQTVSIARNIISLPSTAKEFKLLAPVMLLALKVLRRLRIG